MKPLEAGFKLDVWVESKLSENSNALAAAVFADDPEALVGTTALDESDPGSEFADCCRIALAAAGYHHDDEKRWQFADDPSPIALRSLRHWASEQLTDVPVAVDDVVLALSELATNVERYADQWLNVDLIHSNDLLIVAVTDPRVDRLPARQNVTPDQLTGRGLMVVAALALAWGVVVRSSNKTVWAAFPVEDI